MADRRHSARRIRRLRTYNVAEAAKVTGATPATVRAWMKQGLPSVRNSYPAIIRGADLIDFLQQRAKARKKPCGPGRLFCLSCKEPKRPACGEVEYQEDGPVLGTIVGLCPDCTTIMRRRSSRARLPTAIGDLRLLQQPRQMNLSLPTNSSSKPDSEEV